MRETNIEWIIRGESFQMEENDARDDFPAILAHLIRQRNIAEQGALDRFLEPKLKDLADPFLLPEMAIATQRIFIFDFN